jgi:hypothetical protein
MKFIHLTLGAAALALAACGQSAQTPAPEAPAAPQSLMEQVQSQPAEQQLVTAYQALVAYQQAHPDSQPVCSSVRGTESRGVIPANVAPDSIYAPYAGAQVYSIQCGALISATRYDPNEHWLVVYAPGAAEVAIVNCGNPRGDSCPRTVPTVVAPPAAPAAPATTSAP